MLSNKSKVENLDFFASVKLDFFQAVMEINEPLSYYCYFVVFFAVSS